MIRKLKHHIFKFKGLKAVGVCVGYQKQTNEQKSGPPSKLGPKIYGATQTIKSGDLHQIDSGASNPNGPTLDGGTKHPTIRRQLLEHKSFHEHKVRFTM